MRLTLLLLCVITPLMAAALFAQEGKQVSNTRSAPAIAPNKGYVVQEIRAGLYWVTVASTRLGNGAWPGFHTLIEDWMPTP